MSKWLKNTTGSTKSYFGQDILTNSYYQLLPQEEFKWSNDSTLLADISSGDILVAKDDSGSNDITDLATALNYLKDIDDSPKDIDGAPLTRTKITKSGNHFQLHSVEFSTSTINSLFNEDVDGNDLGFATIKFYNSSDVELVAGTQVELDVNCVKTVIEWEPDENIEVIGGLLEQSTTPITDIRMWITAVPDLTVAQGGSIPFVQGGLNLRYLSSHVDLDGKTPKEMTYNATYHTNKFRITLKHGTGVKNTSMLLFKIFRANV